MPAGGKNEGVTPRFAAILRQARVPAELEPDFRGGGEPALYLVPIERGTGQLMAGEPKTATDARRAFMDSMNQSLY